MVKKTRKSSFEKLLVLIGVFFSILLGIMKILFDLGTWMRVFSPLIITFIIIFILNSIKSGAKKYKL